MRLGIISDTHGLLRPEVHDVFGGVDRILHAGDVGNEEVLEELGLLAPVTAVYGNTDGSRLRSRLEQVVEVSIDDLRFVVTHGDQLGLPSPEGLKEAWPDADVIVFGHTHRPLIRDLPNFSVVLNPGSAGPARPNQPVTVAIMETEPGIPPRARIVKLLEAGRS